MAGQQLPLTACLVLLSCWLRIPCWHASGVPQSVGSLHPAAAHGLPCGLFALPCGLNCPSPACMVPLRAGAPAPLDRHEEGRLLPGQEAHHVRQILRIGLRVDIGVNLLLSDRKQLSENRTQNPAIHMGWISVRLGCICLHNKAPIAGHAPADSTCQHVRAARRRWPACCRISGLLLHHPQRWSLVFIHTLCSKKELANLGERGPVIAPPSTTV